MTPRVCGCSPMIIIEFMNTNRIYIRIFHQIIIADGQDIRIQWCESEIRILHINLGLPEVGINRRICPVYEHMKCMPH